MTILNGRAVSPLNQWYLDVSRYYNRFGHKIIVRIINK